MSKAKQVQCIIIDIDGVMTDAKLHYTEEGVTMKSFNVRDGLAIVSALRLGIKIGVISGGREALVKKRLEDLGIEDFFLGHSAKLPALEEIRAKYKLDYSQMAYIGDDWIDIDPMRKVGFAVAVNDAAKEVKKEADYITKARGGEGAVREAIELIASKKFGKNALANVWIHKD